MSGPAKIDIGLAFSTDMIHFTHLGGRNPHDHCILPRVPAMIVRTGEPFIGVGRDGTWESRFVWAAPQPVVMEERGEIWIYYSGVNRDHAGILDPKAPTPPADGCIPEKSGGSNDVTIHL
eukprot:COSAG04_NODE_794_length_10264_cov_35.102804_15_plen_120_part_00